LILFAGDKDHLPIIVEKKEGEAVPVPNGTEKMA
jgi:hypothetical protein